LEAARDRGCQSTALDDERVAAWRSAVAPHQRVNFEKRLQWCGTTIEHAAWAVNPPADAVQCRPRWLPLLEQLQQVCADRAAALHGDAAVRHGPPRPFEELWWPICHWAPEQVQHRLPAIVLDRVAPQALRALARALLERLADLGEHALFEEFSRYRGAGRTLLAGMSGDQPDDGPPERDAYAAFIEHHLSDGLTEMLTRYPVLGRLVSTVVQSWFEASQELLERVHHNRAVLSDVFGIPVAALLSQIDLNLSDPHRGGRSVAALHFSSSTGARWTIVYKPRNMDIDRAYHAFLRDLNELAGEPAFRVLKVLPLEGYGFMEFVDHRPCRTDGELERFYHHAGRMLAVLYMLGGTDCHNENVIAHGTQLVLVDVETLFQGDRDGSIGGEETAFSDLQDKVGQSVLRVGLLPQWRFIAAGGRQRAIDASALGVTPPKHTTTPRDGWIGVNSDRMHWGQVEVPTPVPVSCPVPVARPNLLQDFQSHIGEGFALQMRDFLRYKNHLLAVGAPLERFAGLPRRVVVRPTQMYAVIQRQGLQAAALETAAARGVTLDQLSRTYLVAREKPVDWPVFESELRQMENLDIPYFEQTLDSDALRLPDDRGSIPGFLSASGLAASRTRLERLDQTDIDFQLQLIRGAIEARQLTSMPFGGDRRDLAPAAAAIGSGRDDPVLSDARRVTEALRLGMQVQRRILRDRRGRPEWLGVDLGEDQERFQFGLVGPSFYSGRSGIALFFSMLAQHLETQSGFAAQAARFREDARDAMSTIVDPLHADDGALLARWLRDQPLGLAGGGGLMLTLLMLDRSGLRPRSGNYTTIARAVAEGLTVERIHADKRLNVIGGCAGVIGPLLALARVEDGAGEPDGGLLALAVSCGEHLVAHQSEDGGWPHLDAKKPLTGFSHGAAGIAAALARLHRATGMADFLRSAQHGLDYERSQFSPERGNWPDFRTAETPTQFMNSWCHGAPGIALSRLCLRGTALWNTAAEQEVQVALATTMRDAVPVDQLCCGSFGRAAILRIAAACGLGAAWARAAEDILARSVALAERSGGAYRLFSLAEGHVFLPGLFTGNSGIGVVLLKVDDWRDVATCLSAGLLE